jgi:hypothetical protein
MQFLKKHYEKIILSLVLLGLAATAVWFYTAVEHARSNTGEQLPGPPHDKPWTNLDLTKELNALKTFNSPPGLVLSGEHNLFNPLTWKQMPDGASNWFPPIKITQEGPVALKITDITPILYRITFDRQAGDAYRLNVIIGNGRPTSTGYYHLNEHGKNQPAIITGTNTASDGSTTLTLNIVDTGEVVSVATNKPYQRVDSYTVDMQYPPDNATFSRMSVNQNFRLSQEPYKIVAITNNAVTVQANKTSKRTTIEWSGSH